MNEKKNKLFAIVVMCRRLAVDRESGEASPHSN